jgi:hypothetical protein
MLINYVNSKDFLRRLNSSTFKFKLGPLCLCLGPALRRRWSLIPFLSVFCCNDVTLYFSRIPLFADLGDVQEG